MLGTEIDICFRKSALLENHAARINRDGRSRRTIPKNGRITTGVWCQILSLCLLENNRYDSAFDVHTRPVDTCCSRGSWKWSGEMYSCKISNGHTAAKPALPLNDWCYCWSWCECQRWREPSSALDWSGGYSHLLCLL